MIISWQEHIPELGAIMQTKAGKFGHVAYVESVGPDGEWMISEMNFKGWGITDTRISPADSVAEFSFIH